MVRRHRDGSAGDVDYGVIGAGYSRYRQPEPRFAQLIDTALGAAVTVLNVGAGTGSYEPTDRVVSAVEPSASMRAQRWPHLPEAVDAHAESLPFDDDRFDAALASFTVHQWNDLGAGLGEMRRVTRGPIVVLTCDPARLHRFWLAEYCPEVIAVEAGRYPALDTIGAGLGGDYAVVDVPIPLRCTDGFTEAYYGRPEHLLDPGARRANSAWSLVPDAAIRRFRRNLSQDLADRTWDHRYGHLRMQDCFTGSLVLVVSTP